MRQLALLATLLLIGTPSIGMALDKESLTLVFEEDFESGSDRWSFTDAKNWRVEQEGETGNHVLALFQPSGNKRPHFAPRSVATIDDLTLGSFVLEARVRHRGKAYAHQDLCMPFNIKSEHQFYYAHFAPVADEGANTVFILNDADRKSIAIERTDGTKWGGVWHDIRIVRDARAGDIEVYVDDMSQPAMVANDVTFATGQLGLGSFNDIGWFDDVRIWAPEDDVDEGEFVSLFDGKSLTGWKASDMRYWSVEDGAITAQWSEEQPITQNQFLVWQGGDVANFALKAKFRLHENRGNSGIQFRSHIADDGTGVGYQADILPGGPWCGALADEYTGREPLMVPNGHQTVVDYAGNRTVTPIGEPVALRPAGEWNDYHITARGHRMTLRVNGKTSAIFVDYDKKEFDPSGILALQLHAHEPMKVQFKDIEIKHLPDAIVFTNGGD